MNNINKQKFIIIFEILILFCCFTPNQEISTDSNHKLKLKWKNKWQRPTTIQEGLEEPVHQSQPVPTWPKATHQPLIR